MGKRCCQCKNNKPLNQFTKSKEQKDGFSRRCKLCTRINSKKYYYNNRKKRQQGAIQYYILHKNEKKQYNKEYQKNNLIRFRQNGKRWRDKNKIRERLRMKEWEKNNPDKVREKRRRRRNLELHTKGLHTEQEWQEKKKEYNYRCAYCGIHENALKKKYTYKNWWSLTEDHIQALSKNGSDYITNIIPACISCNSSKNNKDKYVRYKLFKHK